MKVFDYYFGLCGLLDEVEVFIWLNLMEIDNLVELLLDNDMVVWFSFSLSDEDYVFGWFSQVVGKFFDNLCEMFFECGGYFLLCDSCFLYWYIVEYCCWLWEIFSFYVLF